MGRIVDIAELLPELGLAESCTDLDRVIALGAIDKAEAVVRKHIKYDPVKKTRTEFYPQGTINQPTGPLVWEANATQAYARISSEGSTDLLLLQHVPVRADVAIRVWVDYGARFGTVAGSFTAESEKVLGTDFWPAYGGLDDDGLGVSRDGIIRSVGMWPLEPGSVKVTYSAGYSAEEFRGEKDLVDATLIREAVIDEAVRRFKKIQLNRKSSRVGWTAGPLVSERLGSYSYSADSSAIKSLYSSQNDLAPETVAKLQDFVNWGWAMGG